MATRTTLNNIITNLEAIADAHKQVKSFGFGDVWEINTSGDTQYPLMWADLEPVTISNGAETVSFNLIFCDRVQKGEVNEQEVLSDQLEIAKDVIAQLGYHGYEWEFLPNNLTLLDFTESFPDDVSGYTVKIGLVLPYDNNRCVIPTTDPDITDGAGSGTSGSAAGTINIYYDGTLLSTTASTDLDAEIVNISL